MAGREAYKPGPANGANVEKSRGDSGSWKLTFVRELRHPPELVWEALTDPEQLAQRAPFDANRNLAAVGPDALRFGGWQQLNADYAAQF